MDEGSRCYQIADLRETEQLAAQMAAVVNPPFWIALEGALGAGKTTLTRALLRNMGWQGTVRSPTYTLIESYDLVECTCYHLDLYRLADPEELEYLGWRELQHDKAIVIVEWASQGQGVLPDFDWEVELQPSGMDGRVITLSPRTEKGRLLAAKMPSALARNC